MTKIVLQLHKFFSFAIVFWLLTINYPLSATDTPIDTVVFEVTVENNHTEIDIQNTSDWHFKFLNGSPAAKIMIKATFPDKNIEPKLNIEQQLPEKSGIKSLRVLPLNPDSYLISLELIESLEFGWASTEKNRIILKDEHLFDESELNYRQGLAFHKQGSLQDALNLYRKVVFKNKKHANAYFKAAQIRWDWNQNQLAEINFKHAERLGCDSLNLFKQMADFYESDGRMDLANKYRETYEKKLKLENQKTNLPDMISVDAEDQQITLLPDSVPIPFADTETTESIKAKDNRDFIMPTKILFYAIGSIFLLIFIGIWFYNRIRKRAILKNDAYKNIPGSFIRSELDPTTEEFIGNKTLENIKAKKDLFPIETEQYNSNKEESESGELIEGERSEITDERDTDFPLDINVDLDKDYLEEIQEMDLYDNLLEKRENVSSSTNLAPEIFRLYESNVEIAEIARKLGIGQGEVELFLKFKQDIYNNH